MRLTPKQQDQLAALHLAGAISKDTGVSQFSEIAVFNNMVCGRLRDLGLAASRPVRRPAGGSQRTEYWLTDAGLAAAQQLSQEAR